MYHVMTQIDFCYGHRLCDFSGPCQYLHGHNGRAEITLTADELDRQGMVYEFGALKQVLKDWVDQTLDHRVLLRQDDSLVPVLQQAGEPLYLMDRNPTAEAIAEAIYCFAEKKELPVLEVRLWETPQSSATYRKP